MDQIPLHRVMGNSGAGDGGGRVFGHLEQEVMLED